MSYGNQQGGYTSIGPIPGIDPHIGTSPTNYYANDRIAAVNNAERYIHNPDPMSASNTSKGNHYGLNPFQNNFSEQILKYKDDGTVSTGRTICIG